MFQQKSVITKHPAASANYEKKENVKQQMYLHNLYSVSVSRKENIYKKQRREIHFN